MWKKSKDWVSESERGKKDKKNPIDYVKIVGEKGRFLLSLKQIRFSLSPACSSPEERNPF